MKIQYVCFFMILFWATSTSGKEIRRKRQIANKVPAHLPPPTAAARPTPTTVRPGTGSQQGLITTSTGNGTKPNCPCVCGNDTIGRNDSEGITMSTTTEEEITSTQPPSSTTKLHHHQHKKVTTTNPTTTTTSTEPSSTSTQSRSSSSTIAPTTAPCPSYCPPWAMESHSGSDTSQGVSVMTCVLVSVGVAFIAFMGGVTAGHCLELNISRRKKPNTEDSTERSRRRNRDEDSTERSRRRNRHEDSTERSHRRDRFEDSTESSHRRDRHEDSTGDNILLQNLNVSSEGPSRSPCPQDRTGQQDRIPPEAKA